MSFNPADYRNEYDQQRILGQAAAAVQETDPAQTQKDLNMKQIQDAQQLAGDMRVKADFKPEIFFSGQIVGG